MYIYTDQYSGTSMNGHLVKAVTYRNTASIAGLERPSYVQCTQYIALFISDHLNIMYYGHPVTPPNTVFHTELNFVIQPAFYKRSQKRPWTFDSASYGHLDYKC